MEFLLGKLQKLKQHQLAVLQRPVLIDNASLKKREDEVICNLKDVMKKLSPLGSQQLRLLYVLAHENYELLVTHSKEKQSKLQEKIHRKYILYGDKFLIDHIPAHQTLALWYTKVKQLVDEEDESSSISQESQAFKDKYAFNVKYDPLCSKCKELIGLTKSNLRVYKEMQTSLASMSFSTRHRGFCCRVTLQAACQLCQILSQEISDGVATMDGDVKITIDPYFYESATANLQDEGIRDVTAEAFITEKIWTAIDEMATTTDKLQVTAH